MTTTSRRAILAGLAVSPALAASTLTLAGATALSLEASLKTTAPALATDSASSPVLLDDGPVGALARFDMLLDRLRNLHICNGWSVDEMGAAQALQYFRERAAAGTWAIDEDNEAEMAKELATSDFLREHGQSLDWIICGDLGALVAGAAVHSPRADKVRVTDIRLDPRYARSVS
jgi:hypothetical protein